MENKFEIHKDKTVACYAKQLYLQVIDEQETFPPEDLIISAQIEHPGGTEVYFKIMYPKIDRDFKKWNMDLFFDAAEYYCQVVLDGEPTGFSCINQQNFYPYEHGEISL